MTKAKGESRKSSGKKGNGHYLAQGVVGTWEKERKSQEQKSQERKSQERKSHCDPKPQPYQALNNGQSSSALTVLVTVDAFKKPRSPTSSLFLFSLFSFAPFPFLSCSLFPFFFRSLFFFSREEWSSASIVEKRDLELVLYCTVQTVYRAVCGTRRFTCPRLPVVPREPESRLSEARSRRSSKYCVLYILYVVECVCNHLIPRTQLGINTRFQTGWAISRTGKIRKVVSRFLSFPGKSM